MRKFAVIVSLLVAAVVPAAHAQDESPSPTPQGHMGHDMRMRHEMMADRSSPDRRTALKASPMVFAHQKAQMREHLRAAQETLASLAKGDFAAAADTAHEKLGVSPQMRKMCGVFGDETFRTMGMTFHERADHVADVARTGDLAKTVAAYADMIQACVDCHDAYRFGE
jgi:cytochrome c556